VSGDRVHSDGDLVPGHVVERGGELIGSNHPLWQFYARHFDLDLSDVKGYGNSPIRFKGHTLSFEDGKHLTGHMELEFKLLTDLAATIVDPFEPWTNADVSALDRMSLWDWLVESRTSQACREAVAGQLAADNGIAASEQSLLGVVAMIRC
jgi:monoamine oxidase